MNFIFVFSVSLIFSQPDTINNIAGFYFNLFLVRVQEVEESVHVLLPGVCVNLRPEVGPRLVALGHQVAQTVGQSDHDVLERAAQ